MTAQSKTVIKSYFETNDRPTQAQFIDFIDSYQDFNTPTNSYYVDIGAASAYVIVTSPVTSAYTDGMTFYVKFISGSAGGSTLNAGPGPVPLTFMDGTGLSSGTIPANGIGLVAYSSTNASFQLLNIIPSTSGGAITALTGDVTASGTGSVAATIADNAVTLAKLATQAANTVLVNATAGAAIPTAVALTASSMLGRGSAGNIVPVTVGSGLAMSAGGVLSASGSSAIVSVHSQVFTSNSTYTPTTGMVFCIARGVGGGGGSGGCPSGATNSMCSGGGGGGGYAEKVFSSSDIGASKAVAIGAAGAAGAAAGNGGDGGDTTLGTTLLVAKGGTKSLAGTNSPGSAGGAGGIAGTGDITFPGQAGGTYNISALGHTLGMIPAGGSSEFGYGGLPGTMTASSSRVGTAGSNYGAGASGSWNDTAGTIAGAAGKAGILIITEFCTS